MINLPAVIAVLKPVTLDQQNTKAIKVRPRTLIQTLLLCSGIIGSILFAITSFILGITTANYNTLSQVIGDLELLGHGWMQSVNFIVFGLFTGVFAIGLHKELISSFGSVSIPLFQLFIAFGAILMGIFINEPVHTYVTLVAFASLIISFYLFAVRFGDDPRWKGWAIYSIISAVLMMVFVALFLYAKSTRWNYTGIIERLLMTTHLVWLVIFTDRIIMGRRLTPLESD